MAAGAGGGARVRGLAARLRRDLRRLLPAAVTSYGLAQGPDETDRLFHGAGLCLKSLACGVTGGDPATFSVHDLPSEWFGEVEHTHRAIDDARGYAHLLVEVLRRGRKTG